MADTPLPPRWRRLYAHVLSLELACPKCGRLWGVARGVRTAHGYDKSTGLFRCAGCGGRWFVGVLLWPAGRQTARPQDHVLSPGEAAEVRRGRSAVTEERARGWHDGMERQRASVNMRCSCGERCPVHEPGAVGAGDEDDD